ncbi:MAG: tetratricopeptide repeat protein [Oculatellaceae cyanobacterium bins.114]|nr:tetratricopeptide repeat protein [Oculatellaceae cyanobacterium bins.114]
MPFNKLFKRSNKKQATPTPDATPSEPSLAKLPPPLIAQNQDTFEELVTFLDFVEGFKIGFVEVNFGQDSTTLLEALQTHPQCQTIQFAVFNFSNPDLRYLRDELVKAFATVAIEPDKKLVLVIQGLENTIGMTGDYPPMLVDLNYIRDAFPESLPHPLLFFLPDYALTRLARFAPDFWDWRSGVFRFRTTQNSQDAAFFQTLNRPWNSGRATWLEWQDRIDTLQRLAMEYRPLMEQGVKGDLKNYVLILTELGEAYRHLGEVHKAKEQFDIAILVSQDQPNLAQYKAGALHELGILKTQQGEIEGAIALYYQVLALDEQMGNLKGKATTLCQLGNLKAEQGEIEEAIALYQQSLTLHEQMGNLKGKATTLHQFGILKMEQGEIEEAIALCQESLALHEQIGDIRCKAANLHLLGSLKAEQGENEEALAFYQRSLALDEQTGNLRNKADTLHQLGILKAEQGEIEEAIALYQQSLDLKEKIGNVQGKAATLGQLGSLKANQGKIEEAIALFHQVLELQEKFGDAHGKAITLSWLGYLVEKQGNLTTALNHLQPSLEILQRLQLPHMARVQAIYNRVRVKALQELATLKANQGKIEEAIALFHQVLELQEKSGDAYGRAITLSWLGYLAEKQGDLTTALTHLQPSLEILQSLQSPHVSQVQAIHDRVRVKALQELATLKANQGEIEEAIALYQQSLEIDEQIGNVQGRATTLYALGACKVNQGEIEEGSTLLRQALDLTEQSEDVKGKVMALNCLGMLKAIQGEVEEAIVLYQQLLTLAEQARDMQSKGVTLLWLGVLAELQDDLTTALTYAQQSLEILQQLQSPEAAKVQEMRDRLRAKLSSEEPG